ncbi:hypothetical protein, partial [Alistipes ihumii]|uniref:hypothetical protein n=1 Tax=Alistipes ihumii TaxID=1470347 RepID=UPI00307B5518
SGELANTSSNGYYWSSSPYYGGNSSAGYLNFYSGIRRPAVQLQSRLRLQRALRPRKVASER